MKKIIEDYKKYVIIFLIITIASMIVRVIGIKFESRDYIKYLSQWFEQVKQPGGIANYKGNYNLPYVLILSGLTHLPGKPLYLIKASSIVFDYILAILRSNPCL